MSKMIHAGILVIAIMIGLSAIGCQSPGGGGYGSSDGHAGHSH